jgi:hypothetical protein
VPGHYKGGAEPCHLEGLEGTTSAPGDGRSERRRGSIGERRQRAGTLATERIGAANKGGAERIERGGGVDPRVLVLCNQRRRPEWPRLAGIGAGGGGGIGVEQSRERGGSGAEVSVGS